MTDRTEAERVKLALRLAIVSAQLKESREALDGIRAQMFPSAADSTRTGLPAGRACTCPTSAGGAIGRRSLPARQCEGTGRLRPAAPTGGPTGGLS